MKKQLLMVMPKEGHDKLKDIAKNQLGFAGISDLVAAALAEYCQKRGIDLVADELKLGQWGGAREKKS